MQSRSIGRTGYLTAIQAFFINASRHMNTCQEATGLLVLSIGYILNKRRVSCSKSDKFVRLPQKALEELP
jgi:hypothetical protein